MKKWKKILAIGAVAAMWTLAAGCARADAEVVAGTEVAASVDVVASAEVVASTETTEETVVEMTTESAAAEVTTGDATVEPATVETTAEATVAEATAAEANSAETEAAPEGPQIIYVTVGDATLSAILEDNSSAEALAERLSGGDITINMNDYASFEKVGALGFDLPRNDRQITTKAGDIILYQGNSLVFYYDTNSWNFTKLGEFQNVTQAELMEIFGDGSITATISLTDIR